MAQPSGHEVTQLLRAWSEGDSTALEKLIPLVYQELHRLARIYMVQERPGHTLQATALVHEAYVRLVDTDHPDFENRVHFFGACAQVMRRILVDWARSRQAQKRWGEVPPLDLDRGLEMGEEVGRELVALDDALKSLSAQDPRKCQVVELRFFGGLSVEEAATVLKVSPKTVKRDWNLARAWLARELQSNAAP
jgi:RNA polymerase sigma factor (TIGR02999 family)